MLPAKKQSLVPNFSKYTFIALTIAFAFLIFSAWLPNLALIKYSLISNRFDLSYKINLLIGLSGSLLTNFSRLSLILTTVVALLFGINISLFLFYLNKQKQNLDGKTASLSLSGVVLGLTGIGCAACGSVILSLIFGLGITSSFIVLLPLKGQEFSLVSILFLVLSITLLIRQNRRPNNCQIS